MTQTVKLEKLKQDAVTYVTYAGTKNLILVVKNKGTKKRHALVGELSVSLILNIFRFDGSKSRLKDNYKVYDSLVNDFDFIDLGYKYDENVIASVPRANRGQAIEKLVCTDLNGTTTSYGEAFTMGGDIVIKGVHYQVKTHDATLANPNLLRNLEQ